MTEEVQDARPDDGAGADDASPESIWDEFEAADGGKRPEDEAEGFDDPQDEEETSPDSGESGDEEDDDEDQSDPAPADTGAEQDIWANATPEQKAAFEEIAKKAAAAEHEISSHKGRALAAQRRLDEFRQQSSAKPAADADKGDKDDAAGTTDETDFLASEQWKALKEDYPEIAGPLEGPLAALKTIQRENAALKAELGGISSERREANLGQQEGYVREQHADLDDLVAAPEWTDWLVKQPAYVQQAIARNADQIVDGQEAAHIIGQFKAMTGWTAKETDPGNQPDQSETRPLNEKRKAQLESGAGVKTRGSARVHDGMPDPDDAEGAWDYWEKRDQEAAR